MCLLCLKDWFVFFFFCLKMVNDVWMNTSGFLVSLSSGPHSVSSFDELECAVGFLCALFLCW